MVDFKEHGWFPSILPSEAAEARELEEEESNM